VAGTAPSLRARTSPPASPGQQRERLDRLALPREFHQALADAGQWPLTAGKIEILQLNLGTLCNQTCRHCHVDAGPDRREQMSRETMEQCLAVLERSSIPTVDITGGAPELNPHFRWLVERCVALGRKVTDRCNLTVLERGAQRDLPEFFARHGVECICSLPHYRSLSTDRQRGTGVHEASIAALKHLDAVGYGEGRRGLRLVLVTNPVGAYLPQGQQSMESEWKRELLRLYGVRFDALYCMTNMPIGRFYEWLSESGNLETYLNRLVSAFNPSAVSGVMCRNLLSVGWDGQLFDCDFNQMLGLAVGQGRPAHIRDFDPTLLEGRPVEVGRHCFGCTAGAGSSCGGATSR